MIEEEEEYEVGQVLDSGRVRGKLHFLVRWKGFSPSEDSWEPAELLEHTQEEVSTFYRRHPEAIRDPAVPAATSDASQRTRRGKV